MIAIRGTTHMRLDTHAGRSLPPPRLARPRATFVASCALLLLAAAGRAARAAETSTDWQVGNDYWRQLESPVGVEWAGSPLRQSVASLARTQRICVWLDRRIDPGHPVNFRSDGAVLNVALRKLASDFGCGAGFMESVAYLGPREVAARLATVAALRAEEVKRLPSERQARLLSRRPWRWDDLATPRELLEELGRESRVSFPDLQRIPHDLWPAMELPPLAFPERLSLILAGFSLTFTWEDDGSAVRFAPWPAAAALVRTYAHRGDLDRVARELSQMFPETRAKRAGARLLVSGSYEDHALIARWLRGEKVAVAGATRYNLKIENQPVGGVIQTLARRLGYELEIDPALAAQLDQPVSVRVENATPDELIQQVLRDTGIRATREGGVLKLAPRE